MVEFSRGGIVVVLLVSFVVGMAVERTLSLTGSVSAAVVPFVQSAGGPLLWTAVGAAGGMVGLTVLRRLRGVNSGRIGGGGVGRRSDRH